MASSTKEGSSVDRKTLLNIVKEDSTIQNEDIPTPASSVKTEKNVEFVGEEGEDDEVTIVAQVRKEDRVFALIELSDDEEEKDDKKDKSIHEGNADLKDDGGTKEGLVVAAEEKPEFANGSRHPKIRGESQDKENIPEYSKVKYDDDDQSNMGNKRKRSSSADKTYESSTKKVKSFHAKSKSRVASAPEPASSSRRRSPTKDFESKPKSDRNYVRPIVVDGFSVAMIPGTRSEPDMFCCERIQRMVKTLIIQFPLSPIIIMVPEIKTKFFYCKHILNKLEDNGDVRISYIPRKEYGSGRKVAHQADIELLRHALKIGAVVVSNDTFGAVYAEKPELRHIIVNRVLGYQARNGRFRFPDYPLAARFGPSLVEFMRD